MFDVTLVLYANQQQEMWKTVLLGATKLAKAMINFYQFLSLFIPFYEVHVHLLYPPIKFR